MTHVEDISDNDVFWNIVDTPKKGIEQHKKREYLKSVIDKGKLGNKWTHGRVSKASHETINKIYVEYRQHELNEKRWKNWKTLGKHIINLYSTGISQWLKIKDIKKLRQDIENDQLIKDQIKNLGCLFVYTFGNYLAPVLIATYTANNVDFGDENDRPAAQLNKQDEGYEID